FSRDLLEDVRGAVLWRGPAQFTTWQLDRHIIGKHAGIPIVSFSRDQAERQTFMSRTVEALQIVRQLDPVRFGRLQRQLKYVLQVETDRRFTARYRARFGLCEVNFRKFRFDRNLANTPYLYAAILVHEATHGAIENGEIPLQHVRHKNIEYFCDFEAAQVLRRWEPKAAEIWMKKYNDPKIERRRQKSADWIPIPAS